MTDLTDEQIDQAARLAGFLLESWMTNPPKPAMWHGTPDALRKLVRSLAAAPVPPQQGAEPTEQQAYDMGAKGAPPTERERLLFEAWMRGHCWALCATWDGKQYRSDAEQGGDLDPRAMATRRLFAAWRDRAALPVTRSDTLGVAWRDQLLQLVSDYADAAIDKATEDRPTTDMRKAWDAVVASVEAIDTTARPVDLEGGNRLRTALAAPGVERLRDFYNVGPVQRAAVESFADALAAGVTEDAAPHCICDGRVTPGCPTCGVPKSAAAKPNEHMCGMQGYNPMLGDSCPACDEWRNARAALSSPTSKTAEPAEATNMEKKNAD